MPTYDKSVYRTPAFRAAVRQLKANPDTACVWCGDTATTIDHAIPVALGGTDQDLVPSCWPCNAKRGSALGHALKKRRKQLRQQFAADRSSAYNETRPTSQRFLDTMKQDPPAFLRHPLQDAPPSRVW